MTEPQPAVARSLAEHVPEIFAANVFSIDTMRRRLPRNVFASLMKTIEEGEKLDPSLADVLANAMKDWAIEKGATHFCHWFQPMTGLTAEKHDSFISPTPDGDVRMLFNGKELTRGEPDASSFPSGGLREGFEARGYTVWDCTSPAFVKEDGSNVCLFIPSAFCSYTGKALDNKTPLLRSIEALSHQAVRVLRALGDEETRRVQSMVGVEQEYFLVDEELARRRLDLTMTGRTLFGADTPKGMAMSVHYFGSIHERMATFMNEVNVELWKLGVSANTQHHEISPCQFEVAPVFGPANVATDHNHLTMEALQKVAERNGLRCLLHAKPFKGFGGSGKHHNWSMMTDRGANLLDPGRTPWENEVFLVFLCAVIRAVDEYADVLRASIANSGNDHRLGAMEAPPAIISIFLGEQLSDVLERIEKQQDFEAGGLDPIRLGVSTLPPLPKDTTDRNRTSPFAFTGNRFEFRTPGSALATAKPIFVLNTIVAEVLSDIADRLEAAGDKDGAAQELVRELIRDHKRVLFDGDSYSDDWVAEAEKRGLPNLHDTVEAFQAVQREEVFETFERRCVLTRDELSARIETNLTLYAQDLVIEGRCAIRMGRQQILPRAMDYSGQLARAVAAVKEAGLPGDPQNECLQRLCGLIGDLKTGLDELETIVDEVKAVEDVEERAIAARDRILPALRTVRAAADQMEPLVDRDTWPFPTYVEMLCLG